MTLNALKIHIHGDNHAFLKPRVSHLEVTEFAVHVHRAHKVDSREKK